MKGKNIIRGFKSRLLFKITTEAVFRASVGRSRWPEMVAGGEHCRRSEAVERRMATNDGDDAQVVPWQEIVPF